MKYLSVILVAVIICFGFIFRKKEATADISHSSGSFSPATVIELFTSEGCNSCPPADQLLPKLAKIDAHIIPLSFHVDYWNRLGWTDSFSRAAYTNRQNDYVRQLHLESSYTPQLIVNGEYECVGGNYIQAETNIRKSLQEKAKIEIRITGVRKDGNKLHVNYDWNGDIAKTSFFAVVIQNHASTQVKAGENKGALLSHINVVRELLKIEDVSKKEADLPALAEVADDNWNIVLFAQDASLHIVGATIYR